MQRIYGGVESQTDRMVAGYHGICQFPIANSILPSTQAHKSPFVVQCFPVVPAVLRIGSQVFIKTILLSSQVLEGGGD